MKKNGKNIFLLKLIIIFSQLFINISGMAQSRILSVLCPQGIIDAKILSEFERQTRISLRVETTIGKHELEQRLKSSSNNWDVIIANENQLISLSFARLIRPYKEEKPNEAQQNIFLQKSHLLEESRLYLPLMVDPLGITWASETLTTGDLSWKTFTSPALNPMWRNRIFLPADALLQLHIAMLATQTTDYKSSKAELAPAFEWLKETKKQMPETSKQIILELLAKKLVVGALWKSDYLKMLKIIPTLEFSVPKSQTYFTRWGAAIVSDTLREDMALNFMSYLSSKRDDLARFAGLLPISSAADINVKTYKQWLLFDDNTPLTKDVESALKNSLAN